MKVLNDVNVYCYWARGTVALLSATALQHTAGNLDVDFFHLRASLSSQDAGTPESCLTDTESARTFLVLFFTFYGAVVPQPRRCCRLLLLPSPKRAALESQRCQSKQTSLSLIAEALVPKKNKKKSSTWGGGGGLLTLEC